MYGWIWRKLPFGVPGKLIGSLLITASVLALLWYVLFPWAEPLLPFDDVQVTQDTGEPGGSGGEPGDGAEPGVGGEPGGTSGDDHELPYDTGRNNTPPPSPGG